MRGHGKLLFGYIIPDPLLINEGHGEKVLIPEGARRERTPASRLWHLKGSPIL